MFKRLPGWVRAIAVDLRGAGQSDKPPTGYTHPHFSADLAAFAGALGISDFTYVGHSMGGSIGYQFALDHPSLLKAAVFVTPASADGEPQPTAGYFEEQDRRRNDHNYALQAYRQNRYYRPVDVEAIAQQSAKSLAQCSESFLRGSFQGMADLRLGGRLGEIRVPTLMIGADHDDAVSLDSVLADYGRIPGCGLHVFSRCNHWPLLEVPDELTGVLLDFIQSVNEGTFA